MKLIILILISLDIKIAVLTFLKIYDFIKEREFRKELDKLDNEIRNIKNLEVYKS